MSKKDLITIITVVSLVAICFVIIILLQPYDDQEDLKDMKAIDKRGKRTIAILTAIEKNKSGAMGTFTYIINGKSYTYTSSVSNGYIGNDEDYEGDCYEIVYDSLNPKHVYLDWTAHVLSDPDSPHCEMADVLKISKVKGAVWKDCVWVVYRYAHQDNTYTREKMFRKSSGIAEGSKYKCCFPEYSPELSVLLPSE